MGQSTSHSRLGGHAGSRAKIYKILTARAANSKILSSESSDCNIIKIFAQRAKTGASVGEKAVLVLKETNK